MKAKLPVNLRVSGTATVVRKGEVVHAESNVSGDRSEPRPNPNP